MTLLRPRLFLAISGAVCLIALVPQWRRPPAELAAIDRSPIGSARVNARLSTTDERIDKIVPFAAAAPAAAVRTLPGLDAPFGEPAASARSASVRLAAPALFPTPAHRRRPSRPPRATPASRRNSLMPTFLARRLRRAPSPRLRRPFRPWFWRQASFRRRPRSVPRPRSSTTRATLRASRRSQRPRATRPGERRWNGRRCAPTRIRPSPSLRPSSRPIRPGPAAARFATGRKANWPRIPRLRPRSPSFSPAARRRRARERSPRRAPQERWAATTKHREQSEPCGATGISTP